MQYLCIEHLVSSNIVIKTDSLTGDSCFIVLCIICMRNKLLYCFPEIFIMHLYIIVIKQKHTTKTLIYNII